MILVKKKKSVSVVEGRRKSDGVMATVLTLGNELVQII